ncbi:MAG: ABC transporter permease [Candidatus Aureabacteria bacterium]|nr:ABC transporter permease [Candidatus Auribacterota bacterium]
MFERIKSILIKEFRQVMRDPRMRMTIFVTPLIQMIIFGYAANTDVRNVPTAIYDLDNTKESRDVIRAFTYSQYFHAKFYIATDAEQNRLINKARVSAVLRFDRGFGRDIEGNRSAQLQIILDATDSNTAGIILSYANQIIQRYSNDILQDRAMIYMKRINAYPSVDTRDRAWFNENLESRNYYIPGVIALIISVMTLLLTSMSIVREKEIGTMEQLIVSPLRPIELILGKLTPFAIIALIQVVFITSIGVLWFQIPLRGSVVFLLVSTMVYLLTSLGVGLFISTLSATQQEAMLSTFLFFFPANLLSGFMYPIQNMPVAIQYITYLNPLRYYLVILRGIFLKGIGISILWQPLLALLIIGLGVITLSSLRFRKTLGR